MAPWSKESQSFARRRMKIPTLETLGRMSISFGCSDFWVKWVTVNPLLSPPPPGGLIVSTTFEGDQTNLWFPGVVLLFLTIRKWYQFSTEN